MTPSQESVIASRYLRLGARDPLCDTPSLDASGIIEVARRSRPLALCATAEGTKLGESADLEEIHMAELTRRQFLKVTGMSLVGSSLAVMGFSPGPALAEVREYKLTRATETRNTCPYCSVACGVLMYGLGDAAKNAQPSIFHIEGDPDHPVNRGTLCPK